MHKIKTSKIVLLFVCLFSAGLLLADTDTVTETDTASTIGPAPPAPKAPIPPPALPSPPAKPTPEAPVSPPAPPAKPVVMEYNSSGELPVCNENCKVKKPPKCCLLH